MTRARYLLAAGAALTVISFGQAIGAGAIAVKDPIAPAGRSEADPMVTPNNCPAPPPAPRSVNGTAFYTDDKHSVIDPERFKDAANQEEQVRGYTRQLDNIANALLKPSGPHAPNRSCLRSWLLAWAQAGALTGETEDNGNNYRVWALTPIAQAFNVVRPATVPYDEDNARIAQWIGRLAAINKAYVAQKDIRNNISYWAGAGLALASVSTQDRALLDYAVSLAKRGIATITADGFLPGELNRGQRALEYTGFALDPLAIIAEIAHANGVDLFSMSDKALMRVGLNLIRSEKDTRIFDLKAGIKQSVILPVPIGNYGWAEIANRHYTSPELKSFIASHRPIKFDRMGGDVTLLYGVSPP